MKKILFLTISVALLYTSCKKMAVDTPNLNITLDKLTYKLGDTVTFNLSGNADYVNFYSGEAGKNYDNKDAYTSSVSGNPEFQFTSSVQSGNAATKGLSILVSNDFNGTYDQTNVRSATWTDVTNRVTLATSATTVSSGIANLNDLKAEGKPLFVAFRYLSVTSATAIQWQWTISAFQFRTKFTNGTVYTNAPDNATAGFGSLEFAGDSARWVSSATLTHVGLKAGYPADEDWAISRAFSLNSINSDASGVIPVKNISGAPLASQYAYKYAAAGTYKAVFVIRNATKSDSEEKIVTFNITITP